MQLLCCDWLLSTRTDVWERQKLDGELNLNKASRLDGFSKDLRSLQNVAAYIPDIMPKVYTKLDCSCHKTFNKNISNLVHYFCWWLPNS